MGSEMCIRDRDFTGDAWQPTTWSWNDDSDMTHEGVMAAFDHAIEAVAS